MQQRQKIWDKAMSLALAFCFLVANPSFSQTPFTDVLRPSQEVEGAAKLAVTNPESIIISENVGRVKEIFRGEPQKLIINIQDAHCNFEAQTNISQILDTLGNNYGLNFVALEGSSGEIDPSLFTTFPDEEIRKEVATYFLKKGKINGAEYLAITSKNPPKL
ncbi:MAG: hypothetical protein NTV07_01770, partial [Candidatus Omnitrophica bacterium]|nr:hypothetical protein [Candidatus Omnitrophota bacterium]